MSGGLIIRRRSSRVLYLSLQKSKRSYDNKVDIYALGLVLVEILCPFQTEHERNASFENMRRNPVSLPTKFASDFPNQVTTIR